jgi:hypothetical protein
VHQVEGKVDISAKVGIFGSRLTIVLIKLLICHGKITIVNHVYDAHLGYNTFYIKLYINVITTTL